MEQIAENVQASTIAADVESSLFATALERPAERRREPRFPADRLTMFQVDGGNDRERTLCRILDVSRSGMRVRTQSSLQPGTKIRVTLREMFAFAQVRYSIPADGGFDHGIQVYEVHSVSAPAV